MTKSAAKQFGVLFLFGIAHAQLNLASNGTATQSSTYIYQGIPQDASLAVTGEPTHDWYSLSCSTTNTSKTVAWWMLTFPSEYVFVSNIVIYYRSITPSRLAGFSLYITNSTILPTSTIPPSDGLCYHHNGTELPNILQNITCNQMGKHVIIYNQRKSGVTYPDSYSNIAILELCDVQILGCYKSWWGEGCRQQCPSYCIDNHCYPDNGTCVWGCYSNNCINNDCTNDGICTVGCIKGYAGIRCTKRCYKSWWGEGCRQPCPSYCIDNHCYPDNGTCVWGCYSTNCINNNCTNDGICTVGCIKGYAGFKCIERNVANEVFMVSVGGSETQLTQITDGDKTASCITVRGSDSWIQIDTGELRAVETINVIFKGDIRYNDYKLSISNDSQIMADTLNLFDQNVAKYTSPFPTNEHNINSKVVGRYVQLQSVVSSLEICEVEIIGCPSGFYGDQCDISCPSNCDGVCHPGTGHCLFGCQIGFFGNQCESACLAPHYGRLCSETCHCIYQPCNAINGTCPSGGCRDGWEGYSCSTECGRGRYGNNCKQTCEGCLSLECDAVTGICKDSTGCRIGWKHGNPMCNIACTPPQFGRSCDGTCHCINQPCDFISGVCPSGGCQEGWIGQNCSTEILCRTGTLPKYVTYLPSLPVYRYRQNVTFYCASGFYGTSVDSTCSIDNTWIPSPPKCAIETPCDGVSVPLFVSVLAAVIVIAVSVNCGMFVFYRRTDVMSRQTNDKYDDLNVHHRHEMRAEINETTYEELGENF